MMLDLTPNSHNLFMRKCIVAKGKNLNLRSWELTE